MCSLADAIVNAEPLGADPGLDSCSGTRSCCSGGPNTYLPFLQACWRQRIPEVWEERGSTTTPRMRPSRRLIFVPENAELLRGLRRVRCTAWPKG